MSMVENVKVTQVLGYFAAGQVAKNSDIIDMSGYDGVMFIASFGTLVAAGTINVQAEQNTVNSATGMAAVAGTAAHTVTAANAALTQSCIVLDVAEPAERYLRCVVTPATQNEEILGVVAIQYKARSKPTVQAASVLKSTQLNGPAEA